MNANHSNFIAHVRATDLTTQTVAEHLSEVADIAKTFSSKLNVPEAGELIGLLHDFGKYSQNFQDYLKSGTGLLDPDIDNAYVDAKAQKGKIDHSSAGAQWLWQEFCRYGEYGSGNCPADVVHTAIHINCSSSNLI